MSKCDFHKVALQRYLNHISTCEFHYPVNLLHILRTTFYKNISEGLLLAKGILSYLVLRKLLNRCK